MGLLMAFVYRCEYIHTPNLLMYDMYQRIVKEPFDGTQ